METMLHWHSRDEYGVQWRKEEESGGLPLARLFLLTERVSRGRECMRKEGRTSRMNCVRDRSAALISSPEGRICDGGKRKPNTPMSRSSVANDQRILATASAT